MYFVCWEITKSSAWLSFLLNQNIDTTFFFKPKIYILYLFSYTDRNTKVSNIVDKYGRCYDSLCILGIFTYRLTIIFHSCQERNVRQMPGLLWGVFFSRKSMNALAKKKSLGRQIVHKYACWRLRLFLCKITDAVFRIIEMKEMGLTFVQPLGSSNTNILSAWNVFRMFKRWFFVWYQMAMRWHIGCKRYIRLCFVLSLIETLH